MQDLQNTLYAQQLNINPESNKALTYNNSLLQSSLGHLSSKEILSKQIENLYTYESWLRAHERELDSMNQLLKVKEDLSKLDASKDSSELKRLKNLEYTHTVRINSSRNIISSISDSLLDESPFRLNRNGQIINNLAESFRQIELIELIHRDLNSRNRNFLKNAYELLKKNNLGEARQFLDKYTLSTNNISFSLEELGSYIKNLRAQFNSSSEIAENSFIFNNLLSKFNISEDEKENVKRIETLKRLFSKFDTHDFNRMGFNIPVNSDVLSNNLSSMLLSPLAILKNNETLRKYTHHLWDSKNPWESGDVNFEADMRLTQSLFTVSKRLYYLSKAYQNLLNESSADANNANNLWAQYHHTNTLLNSELENLIDKRVSDIFHKSGNQSTIEAFFLISATSRVINSKEENAYKAFLENPLNGEVSHLPTSQRVFEHLEKLLTSNKIQLSDETLKLANEIIKGEVSPEQSFEKIKAAYGEFFNNAFDSYEMIKGEIEPYNAIFILLNQIPKNSPNHPIRLINSNSSSQIHTQHHYINQVLESINILKERLGCDNNSLINLLNQFKRENSTNIEAVNYADSFQSRFMQ